MSLQGRRDLILQDAPRKREPATLGDVGPTVTHEATLPVPPGHLGLEVPLPSVPLRGAPLDSGEVPPALPPSRHERGVRAGHTTGTGTVETAT